MNLAHGELERMDKLGSVPQRCTLRENRRLTHTERVVLGFQQLRDAPTDPTIHNITVS